MYRRSLTIIMVLCNLYYKPLFNVHEIVSEAGSRSSSRCTFTAAATGVIPDKMCC